MNLRLLTAMLLLFLPLIASANNNASGMFLLSNPNQSFSNGSAAQGDAVGINVSPNPPESGILRVSAIDMAIEPSGVVSVAETLTVRSGDIISVLIPSNVDSLQVFDSKGANLSYDSIPAGSSQLISFTVGSPGEKKEEEAVIKYISQHFTGKADEVWTFNYSAETTPMVTIIRISAPKNTQVSNIDFRDFNWAPTGPSEIEVYPLVKDFHLSFSYKIGVSGSGGIIPRPTTSTITSSTMTTTTVPSASRPEASMALIVVVIVLAALIAYQLLSKQKKNETQSPASSVLTPPSGGHEVKVGSMEVQWTPFEASSDVSEKPAKPKKRSLKESIVNMLDENEKKIVKMLEDSGDEITQAYVYKSTGIPKSSLSDTIKRLEKRNIIEIKREGRINWLKLQEWVFD